jgi:hypothetical protein
MDRDLFSCRNCIHNPAQGLTLGRGAGFCLQWGSLIERPGTTTCKYLHRKDLPGFQAAESVRAHAEAFAGTASMVDLETHAPLALSPHDERSAVQPEPRVRAMASYHRLDDGTEPRRSRLLALVAGSVDGLGSMAHACLVRRAIPPGQPMPGSWWRWALALLEDVDRELLLGSEELLETLEGAEEEQRIAATWEVLFVRVSGLQEFGWHAALEELKFPLRDLGAHVAEQDWRGLRLALRGLKPRWRELILSEDAARKLLAAPELEPDRGGAIPGHPGGQ